MREYQIRQRWNEIESKSVQAEKGEFFASSGQLSTGKTKDGKRLVQITNNRKRRRYIRQQQWQDKKKQKEYGGANMFEGSRRK